MTIPYQVEGEKQSEMEIICEKDGKLLKIGKDIQLTVHGDRVQLDVINPKREKSGVYKVIMKNAQGQVRGWGHGGCTTRTAGTRRDRCSCEDAVRGRLSAHEGCGLERRLLQQAPRCQAHRSAHSNQEGF